MSIIEQIEKQTQEYPFCISWFHKSVVSRAGDKSKMQFFKAEDKQKATDAWFKLHAKMKNKETYQQGYISYLTKNF